jgi:hypothetical protein
LVIEGGRAFEILLVFHTVYRRLIARGTGSLRATFTTGLFSFNDSGFIGGVDGNRGWVVIIMYGYS